MRSPSSWPILVLVVLLVSCSADRERVDRAFYEWRSAIAYSPAEIALLDTLDIDRLYVRFFDVQWDNVRHIAYPEAVASATTPFPADVEIVPTVYVTVEALRNVEDEEEIGELASRISTKIFATMRDLGIVRNVREIQIDCDWTATTREAYFALLKEIKRRRPSLVLSSTIRLHQIRYVSETGVPPVDRGMLMVYNVGSVTSLVETNSIFREDEVELYLDRLDRYPLPLDVAFPIFSWGVVFHYDRFARLIDGVTVAELEGRPEEFRKLDENRFGVLVDATLRGSPVYRGDVIRVEEPDEEEVLEVAQSISDDIAGDTISVALFRYDQSAIERRSLRRLGEIYATFE